MKNVQIKCQYKKRLFDVVEGSRLKIHIKCGNNKICPYKANCERTSNIVLGDKAEAFSLPYKTTNCPNCGKRLFDVSKDSVGIVTIKCEMCGKVATIPVVVEEK